MTLLIL